MRADLDVLHYRNEAEVFAILLPQLEKKPPPKRPNRRKTGTDQKKMSEEREARYRAVL